MSSLKVLVNQVTNQVLDFTVEPGLPSPDWLVVKHIPLYDMELVYSSLTKKYGNIFLFVDRGLDVYPRYDIILTPTLNSPVSRHFNGDCYPCGTIVKITPSLRITTSDGIVFRRIKNTGTWKQEQSSFMMVSGHEFHQNPHL